MEQAVIGMSKLVLVILFFPQKTFPFEPSTALRILSRNSGFCKKKKELFHPLFHFQDTFISTLSSRLISPGAQRSSHLSYSLLATGNL